MQGIKFMFAQINVGLNEMLNKPEKNSEIIQGFKKIIEKSNHRAGGEDKCYKKENEEKIKQVVVQGITDEDEERR